MAIPAYNVAVAVAVLGGGVAVASLVLGIKWLLGRTRVKRVGAAPLATLGTAREGQLAAFEVTARPDTAFPAPFTDEPAVWCQLEVWVKLGKHYRFELREQIERPFVVGDATGGVARVATTGATFDVPPQFTFRTETWGNPHQRVTTWMEQRGHSMWSTFGNPIPRRYDEAIIKVGEPLVIIGAPSRGPDGWLQLGGLGREPLFFTPGTRATAVRANRRQGVLALVTLLIAALLGAAGGGGYKILHDQHVDDVGAARRRQLDRNRTVTIKHLAALDAARTDAARQQPATATTVRPDGARKLAILRWPELPKAFGEDVPFEECRKHVAKTVAQLDGESVSGFDLEKCAEPRLVAFLRKQSMVTTGTRPSFRGDAVVYDLATGQRWGAVAVTVELVAADLGRGADVESRLLSAAEDRVAQQVLGKPR